MRLSRSSIRSPKRFRNEMRTKKPATPQTSRKKTQAMTASPDGPRAVSIRSPLERSPPTCSRCFQNREMTARQISTGMMKRNPVTM